MLNSRALFQYIAALPLFGSNGIVAQQYSSPADADRISWYAHAWPQVQIRNEALPGASETLFRRSRKSA